MNEFFTLQSTYEVTLKFSTNTRAVRIEILRSTVNPKKLKARVWDQNTYNLYPTFANMSKENGLNNEMMSCDNINQDITTILADVSLEEMNEIVYGKEWDSEEDFLNYIKELVNKYHATLLDD